VAVAAIDERISFLVAAHRPELQVLVDQALDAELGRLVSERIAARNGGARREEDPPDDLPSQDPPPPPLLCADCGARPRAPGRRICNGCRARRQRAAQHEPAGDPERPAPTVNRDAGAHAPAREPSPSDGATRDPRPGANAPPSELLELALAAAGRRGERARELALGMRRNPGTLDLSPLSP
jgi:hypothetical protein